MAHPAKYSKALMPVLAASVPVKEYPCVLDPFAGTGKIHSLPNQTWGMEIEREWSTLVEGTMCGDSLRLMQYWAGEFDAVVTSPCYGNRMADHHEAKDGSYRNTYRHLLGRELTSGSSAAMQWGDEYRAFHVKAWNEVYKVLRPGGRFVLNIKSHYRKGKLRLISGWHWRTCVRLGFIPRERIQVRTPGQRQGENGKLRVPFEWVLVFDKPED